MQRFSSNSRILLLLVILTLHCIKMGDGAAGSEKDVHYWFMPTVGTVKEASELEVFHDYQPQCVKITTDMYPCDSLQYKSLRMPNLLGQSTIAEVKSFLNSFGDNKFLTCDKYAKHFLCSLVTPLCFDQKSQFKIPPCRTLCERVRDKCFYQLYENGLGIPGEFNCSKFENDNLCMDPTKGTQSKIPILEKTSWSRTERSLQNQNFCNLQYFCLEVSILSFGRKVKSLDFETKMEEIAGKVLRGANSL